MAKFYITYTLSKPISYNDRGIQDSIIAVKELYRMYCKEDLPIIVTNVFQSENILKIEFNCLYAEDFIKQINTQLRGRLPFLDKVKFYFKFTIYKNIVFTFSKLITILKI